MTDNWKNLSVDELAAELQRKEREYRDFVNAQQFSINLKAALIAAMKTEMFRREIAADKNGIPPDELDGSDGSGRRCRVGQGVPRVAGVVHLWKGYDERSF